MTDRSEQAILNDTLVALSEEPDTLIWRNNTGKAWQGQRVERPVGSSVTVEPGMVILRNARPISFGLPGSPDIIGVSGGYAFGDELKKRTGRQQANQGNFERRWKECGGIYLLSRSPEDAVTELRREKDRRVTVIV